MTPRLARLLDRLLGRRCPLCLERHRHLAAHQHHDHSGDVELTQHQETALSDVEPVWRWSPMHRIRHKIHDVPVIWVSGKTGTDRIPWPAEDVRKRETP